MEVAIKLFGIFFGVLASDLSAILKKTEARQGQRI